MALHKFVYILFSIFTALCLVSCDNGEDGHVAGYEALRSQVSECDTVGFARSVCRLRMQHKNSEDNASANLDADILSAWFFAQQEKADSSIFYANRAISLLSLNKLMPRDEWHEQMADLEFIKGAAFLDKSNIDSCYKHLQTSLDMARAAGYAHRMVKIYGLLAKSGRDIHDWQGTMTQIRKAEFVMDTVGFDQIAPACRMTSLAECASVAIDLCNVDVADRLLTKASAIYDKASDRSKLPYLRQLVRLRFFLHQYSQASSAMNKLEMLVGKTGLEHFHADAMAFQGLARCRMGELDWAEQYGKRIDTASLSREGHIVLNLLHGELCAIRKDTESARTFLFDSIPPAATLTPFDWALVNESRSTFWVVQGDYEKAYAVMSEERQRGVEMQTDVFAINNRQREADIQNLQEKLQPQASSPSNLVLLIVYHIIAVAVIILIILGVARWREKITERKTLIKTKHLQEELRSKVAELKQQAKYLESTNDRISESILYAQHIQQAISPSPESLNDFPLSGSFVFFSPLDVVSGDFFWFTRKGNKLVLCCADCTGHGVPGAFLSMISATIINSICERLSEDDLDPSTMLEMLDNSLVENLSHNTTEHNTTKDGLDAVLVVLDLNTHMLKTASARRPIIIAQGDDLITIRGTKRSIGDVDHELRNRKFTTNVMQLAKGDAFYMYTDGYSDQFGGQNGEKMKNSRIEKFLRTILNDSIEEQNLTTQEFFTQWKGDFPQTDDVLFVGVKI